ncbi:hypothetical protein AVEN_238514-1 [Araneus ventricosus]|uniref:Uncharacterized protein n=1 Tax=Araneus ventricosus TaxID=182803 RepID=A0A4Y2RVB9_ARAVE|nr:hypothetical protein AVEN_238514-1 [Araneus ventricosus]
MSSRWCGAEAFGGGVRAQASSSSSEHDSELQGQSQNSPRVDSERDTMKINQSISKCIESNVLLPRHGPFPSYLYRFHLANSPLCNCEEIGTPIHYATSCLLTTSWHMKLPKRSLEQEWYRRVASNHLTRGIIRGDYQSYS